MVGIDAQKILKKIRQLSDQASKTSFNQESINNDSNENQRDDTTSLVLDGRENKAQNEKCNIQNENMYSLVMLKPDVVSEGKIDQIVEKVF